MIHHIILPAAAAQKYYDTHYRFIEDTARAAELKLESKPMKEVGNTYDAEINDRPVVIDFSDHPALRPKRGSAPYFKFHYSEKVHGGKKNVFPIGPVSFFDWDEFFRLKKSIHYEARGEVVVNCQAPGGAALERRRQIQYFLQKIYGAQVDTELTDQETFWRKAGACMVAVFVPGARIDILDRGQFQYMAFGACTISPKLDIVLPFMHAVKPGVHYLECAGDFSDLGEIIEWTRAHRPSCREIGANAAELFASSCLPWKIWSWISECLEASE